MRCSVCWHRHLNRWWWPSMPASLMDATPHGCGMCPSSGCGDARWWRPASGPSTSAYACTTAKSTTSSSPILWPPSPRPARRPSTWSPTTRRSRVMPRASESHLRVCLVYPDLLGTYGDFGNALILTQRLRWRGFEADLIETRAGEDVPGSCDFYVLGGGEDAPQALACAELLRQRSVHRGLEGGAAALAVCARLQIIGSRVVVAGTDHDGLGLIDATTTAGRSRRA